MTDPDLPAVDIRHPAAAMIQDIVMGKARAIERTGVAEIDYNIDVETPDGMKVSDHGTLRRDPFRIEVTDER